MKILRCEVKRFGCFNDSSFQFQDGLNVAQGDNDSGKSILAEALLTVLFAEPGAASPEAEQFKSWGEEHPYMLHLEYEHDGHRFRLTKDVSTELCMLEDTESGSKWNTRADVREKLNEALGFSERDFYLATGFMRQGDLAGIERGTDLIKDKLETLLNQNKDELLASRVLDKLRGRITEIRGEDNDGEIHAIEAQMTVWSAELETARSKTVELHDARQKLLRGRDEEIKARAEFDEKLEVFKKSKLAFEAGQNVEKEREAYLDLGRRTREAQDIRGMISSKKESLRAMIKVERSDVKSAEGLATQLKLYQGRVEDLREQKEEKQQAMYEATPGQWYKILMVVALLGTAAGVFFWQRMDDLLYLGSAGAAFLVSLISVGLWIGAVRAHSVAKAQLLQVSERLNKEVERMQENDESLKELLKKFKAKAADDLADMYEEYRDLDRDIKSLVSRYETLLSDSNLKDLEDELEQMTLRMTEQQQILEKHRAYAVTASELENMQKKLTELDKKQSSLQEENQILEHKLEFLEAGSDILAPLEERISEAENEIALLNAEADQAEIMLRYLEEARRKVLKSSVERVEEEASRLLNQITGAQWCKLTLDRHTLEWQISRDGNTWHSAESGLSTGTQQCASLALRLAFVRVLCAEAHPPLICDEPFMLLDNPRSQQAANILREFSNEYQVIMLTTGTRFKELASHSLQVGSSSQQHQHQAAPTY